MTNRASTDLRENAPFLKGALLIGVIALFYFGFYWRTGLMLSGEEGVAAVIAQRLNAGERPIVDTFLGYNVGWFYPIAWLFKVAGPNYLLMRCWFFLLGLCAGIAAFAIILRSIGKPKIAFLGGLAVILMPGVIGRNYMGLIGVVGMLVILVVFILPPEKTLHRFFWMIGAGVSISLTWLIRIDLGFFQSILFVLSGILFLLKPESWFAKKLLHTALAFALLIGLFLSIQIPVYRDASKRGFGSQYAAQYWIWPTMIGDGVRQVSAAILTPQHTKYLSSSVISAASAQSIAPQPPSLKHGIKEKTTEEISVSYNPTSLKRPPLSNILHAQKFSDRFFALLIYLPLPVSLLFTIWGFCLIIRSFILREVASWKRGGILLVSTGSALVLFPQYFFWRPDMLHLGEFMVPFMVSLVIGVSLAVDAWKKASKIARVCLFLMIVTGSLELGLYLVKGWQTDGSGSIASSRRRHLEFSALNGVHVKLNSQELSRDTLLRDTILANSKPGEYVVCYPYFPMVNFMTDRPSYEYNLYADNAIPKEQFFAKAKANILRFHPAVIVIGTGRINDTESSRFQNWASDTYDYIREHFRLVASDNEVEIYAR
jgi:hypothetical protein